MTPFLSNRFYRARSSHRRGCPTILSFFALALWMVMTPAIAQSVPDNIQAPVKASLPRSDVTGQICWSFGQFDRTVYFGEIEDRPDRRDSFASLLDIIGIDHFAVDCITQDVSKHRTMMQKLIRNWTAAGLEVVNTTFLSDQDY